MPGKRALLFIFTLLCATAIGGVAAAETTAPTSITAPQATPRRATPAEAAAYAQREKKAAPALKKFEGGYTEVVVGTGTLTLILIIVLIVVLV
jgi:hypothetical protein